MYIAVTSSHMSQDVEVCGVYLDVTRVSQGACHTDTYCTVYVINQSNNQYVNIFKELSNYLIQVALACKIELYLIIYCYI